MELQAFEVQICANAETRDPPDYWYCKSLKTEVREAYPISYLSFISEQTK